MIKLHEGRHSAASLARDAGVDPKIRREQLGHTTGAMTDHYTHVMAADRLGRVQGGRAADLGGRIMTACPHGVPTPARLAGQPPRRGYGRWQCSGWSGRRVRCPASTHPGQVSHEVCQHGHAPGCTLLAHDQEADAAARRARLPRLVGHSEPARGPLQRHLLTGRITCSLAPAADGTATSTTLWQPSAATGVLRCAVTAMPTCTPPSPSPCLLLRPRARRPGSLHRYPPAHLQRQPLPRRRPGSDLAAALGTHCPAGR